MDSHPQNTKESANLYSVRIKYMAAAIKKKKSESKNMNIILKKSLLEKQTRKEHFKIHFMKLILP